ncbi:hypothetical protein BJ165DRAFT_1594572 [Panaeolus papilionaceus]|nr:hypothetical protein BJ165DRAFT_1594572 [Panaeolus papilionaceus]
MRDQPAVEESWWLQMISFTQTQFRWNPLVGGKFVRQGKHPKILIFLPDLRERLHIVLEKTQWPELARKTSVVMFECGEAIQLQDTSLYDKMITQEWKLEEDSRESSKKFNFGRVIIWGGSQENLAPGHLISEMQKRIPAIHDVLMVLPEYEPVQRATQDVSKVEEIGMRSASGIFIESQS